MVENVLIAAVGIFIIGIVTGIVVLVSIGIRREERSFREERRFLEEHGIWGSPDAPDHYLLEQAPDGLSSVSRTLNGLHVRHVPIRSRRNAGQDLVS
jgi:hypothetical protein